MYSLALRRDGSLWATGENTDGQLGLQGSSNRNAWKKCLDEVVSMAAGVRHSVAIRRDGSLWGVGENKYGQLGTGDKKDRGTRHEWTKLPVR